MNIKKSNRDFRELTKLETVIINVFYKNGYKYTVSIVENRNILKVVKEEEKTEYFEVEYFEIF